MMARVISELPPAHPSTQFALPGFVTSRPVHAGLANRLPRDFHIQLPRCRLPGAWWQYPARRNARRATQRLARSRSRTPAVPYSGEAMSAAWPTFPDACSVVP